jgi:hypothetical protein
MTPAWPPEALDIARDDITAAFAYPTLVRSV